MYWYMSFADPKKPKGQQWLGGVLIAGSSFPEAHRRTHTLGINPGGEVKAWPMEGNPPPELLDRLLDMEDVKKMSAIMGGTGEAERA